MIKQWLSNLSFKTVHLNGSNFIDFKFDMTFQMVKFQNLTLEMLQGHIFQEK